MTVTLFAQTRDGTQRVELPQATIGTYSERLGQPGALSASLAPRKLPDVDGRYTIPIEDVLEVGVHELGVRRGGSIVWLGPLTGVDETDGRDGAALAVTAEGLAAYMWEWTISSRLPNTNAQGDFVNVDQAIIARSMIAHHQNKGGGDYAHITAPINNTGVLRTRTEYDNYRGLVIGDEIAKLAEVEGGFDWAVTPDRVFRTWYPKRGRRRDDVTLNPSNIIEFSRRIERRQASSVRGFGDGFAEGTLRVRRTDSAAVAKYGFTEGTWAGSGITRLDTLTAHTDAHLQRVRVPPQVISVRVAFGPSLPWGSFGLGDEVRVEWPDSVYRPVSAYRRIVGIDHHPHPDETATVHLSEAA